MGIFLNPTQENSFETLVNSRDKGIFVDKTDFIEEISSKINSDRRFFAVSRPRRFGKTVTAHMLLAYYSKGYDGRKIFDGLHIADKASYPEHLNKYDVIYIDMNTVDGLFDGYSGQKQKVEGVNDLADFFEYSVIRELKSNDAFSECLEKHKIENTGLLETLLAITDDLNTRFIFIMDEWDLVYREYRDDEVLQKKFIKLLKNLFKSDGGKACFSLAYLTGILPIKKYNSQSALNEFKEYNMLRPIPFEKYFGFTEEEVVAIAESPSCCVSRQELKEWYEGYRLNGVDIYNPSSVVSAVSDGVCQSYWSGTSSNEEVVRLINMDFDGIREDILNLIEGDEVSFNCGRFQNDLVSIKDKNDVFCLLVCLGYLGCINPDEETADRSSKQQQKVTNSKNRRIAYVPNAEIKSALMDIVREQEWYERMDNIKRSENLLRAIKELDGDTAADLIQEIHNSSAVSLYDYNSESVLTFCVITGLLWSTLDDYSYHREDQAGKDRVDLVYEPVIRKQPLILIEFKYGESAETALQQIRTQEYFRRYTHQYRNIIIVGISYDPKTKKHQCLIEKTDE